VPRVDINEENITGEGGERFPTVKLETGEYSRMMLPEDGAWGEWVHEMRAPTIGEDGLAVMEPKQRRDGSSYMDYRYMFVAMRICLGNGAVLDDKHVDPDNCPACASAMRGTRDMRPVRRFAVPVIRIATKHIKTTEVRQVPGVTPLIWKLTAKMYDKLVAVKPQIIDLLQIQADKFAWRLADVVILCEDGNWQRMAFQPPMRPAYSTNPKLAEAIRDLWGDKSNRPTDEQLRDACGRAPDRAYMVQEVERVELAWRQATHAGSGTQTDPVGQASMGGNGQPAASLDAGLDSLLDGATPAAAAASPDGAGATEAQAGGAGVVDPLAAEIETELTRHPGGAAEFADRAEDGTVPADVVADLNGEKPTEPADEPQVSSFDDIMAGL
jgi:hypothetical protein